MNCNHCGEELGEGDPYDLMRKHLGSCPSDEAKQIREDIQDCRDMGLLI